MCEECSHFRHWDTEIVPSEGVVISTFAWIAIGVAAWLAVAVLARLLIGGCFGPGPAGPRDAPWNTRLAHGHPGAGRPRSPGAGRQPRVRRPAAQPRGALTAPRATVHPGMSRWRRSCAIVRAMAQQRAGRGRAGPGAGAPAVHPARRAGRAARRAGPGARPAGHRPADPRRRRRRRRLRRRRRTAARRPSSAGWPGNRTDSLQDLVGAGRPGHRRPGARARARRCASATTSPRAASPTSSTASSAGRRCRPCSPCRSLQDRARAAPTIVAVAYAALRGPGEFGDDAVRAVQGVARARRPGAAAGRAARRPAGTPRWPPSGSGCRRRCTTRWARCCSRSAPRCATCASTLPDNPLLRSAARAGWSRTCRRPRGAARGAAGAVGVEPRAGAADRARRALPQLRGAHRRPGPAGAARRGPRRSTPSARPC